MSKGEADEYLFGVEGDLSLVVVELGRKCIVFWTGLALSTDKMNSENYQDDLRDDRPQRPDH